MAERNTLLWISGADDPTRDQHSSSDPVDIITRTPRPLSEIEIQILSADDDPTPSRRASTGVRHDLDRMSRLLPPSLDNMHWKSLPKSLEDLHLEEAYTSMHSQVVKDPKKGFDLDFYSQRRYSESEKSRYARKKASRRNVGEIAQANDRRKL